MNILLVRSEELAQHKFNAIVEFLQSFDGPVSFLATGPSATFDEDSLSLEEVDKEKFFRQETNVNYCLSMDIALPRFREETTWKELFKICQQYRKEHAIPKGELVILLTDVANEHNWFSALDPHNVWNGFVHTAEWEHYVHCPEAFPVAYLVASLVLQKHMFRNIKALQEAVHHTPLGCINDLCAHKREIILKLRTADVCHNCLHLLEDKMDPLALQQILSIFEGVRLRILFTQNFRQSLKPSRLEVKAGNRIFLPDYGNIEIRLTPLEKTLYLFFLAHPEGIMLHDLVDHKEELRRIYARISTSGLLTEIHNRINGLVDVTTNSASEKISKIKATFIKAIGKNLAKHYYIQGEHNGKKAIPFAKELQKNILFSL